MLHTIAMWHNLTPKLWRPDYRVSDKDIEETIARIKNTSSEDLYIAVAKDDEGQPQSFIWAVKREKSKDTAMILSLYTTDKYRGQGIATKLKELLEEWCRSEGIKAIQTTVHYDNRKMLELNQKLGYIPDMVYMTKELL